MKKLYTVKLETEMVVFAEDDAEAATLAWEAYDEGDVNVDFDTSVSPMKTLPDNIAWDLDSIPVGSEKTIDDHLRERLLYLNRLIEERTEAEDGAVVSLEIRRLENQAAAIIRLRGESKMNRLRNDIDEASAGARHLLGIQK